MFRSLRLGVVVLVAGACLVLTASAAAATVTMTGETLNGAPFSSTATINCSSTPGGTHTVDYHVTGTAAGPYPGTFEETGTVTFHDGGVDSFSADFTILSPTTGTTITGHKTLDPVQALITSCGQQDNLLVAHLLFSERYTATVTGPLGSFEETGRSTMTLRPQRSEPDGETAVVFQQDFESGGGPGTTIEVTPVTAINLVATMHTVTAIVSDALGEPVQGITILFTVTPGGSSFCRYTDANGACSLTYQGPDFPQADEITACADTNVNGAADLGEPCATGSKVWTAPATSTGQVMGGGYVKGSGMSFAVGANAGTITEPVKGHCNANDHVAHIKIRCLDIVTMVLTPTHATLFGTAEQDGIATNYQIDVDDLSDFGAPDTFQIRTDLGYVNSGPLTGGNIQIRP